MLVAGCHQHSRALPTRPQEPLPAVRVLADPGTAPWPVVPREQVRELCRLDPDLLQRADDELDHPWAVIRYGRLCHQHQGDIGPRPVWSVTKTVGALVTGMVTYQTRALERTGRKTGPLRDDDRVDHWLDDFSYNRDAQLAHVLAMVAHTQQLGVEPMEYDALGRVQINSLSEILNTALRQDPARLGDGLESFVKRELFAKLGLTQSVWSGENFAFSFATTVHDLARVGLLMLRAGRWNGEALLDADWIYRMTHPAFEEANAGYGYLTWLNATSGYHFGEIPYPPPDPSTGATMPGPCAPVAIYREHPHGLSRSADCNYGPDASCAQRYDVGVWNAIGYGGQIIQGHPGLDMVMVAFNLTPLDTGLNASARLWDAVRPAVVAVDPRFQGNEAAFCSAYGHNDYAPELEVAP